MVDVAIDVEGARGASGGRSDPLIDVVDVSHAYPGPAGRTVLRSVNLRIVRGEHVAIVGTSGSGKSTLLNLLGLLDQPSAGRVVFDGLDVASLRERERASLRARSIGFVFQAFHLREARSLVENVRLGLAFGDTPRAARETRALEALDAVGLAGQAHQRAATLSGGERQRVAIARALVHQPELLLADEPTGNLDSGNTAHVLALLEAARARGTTLVVVTHDADVATRADRCVRMRDGEALPEDAP